MSELAVSNVMESVVIGGDLSKLSPEQRVMYYKKVCETIGLNPLTRPFDYITLNGKLTLYARKDATDQLRKLHSVSIDDVDITENDSHFIVKVKGHDKTGRSDVEIGVVAKSDMQGNIGNAQMKAVTKGKRRLTLSLCGLGMLDETEVETIPDAKPVTIDAETGEITEYHAGDPMTLDQAKEVKNHEGLKYGDLDDAKLDYMMKSLRKVSNPTDEHIRKMSAIELIQKSRSAGPTA